MGWMNVLIETYDNYFNGTEFSDDAHPLVPVGFIEKKVGIRVRINRDASFHSASLTSDNELLCIPSDPSAESRTGQVLPYPLCDEIRYTAGDLSEYSNENYSEYFDKYFCNLSRWCDGDEPVEELLILRKYLQNRSLVSDILSYGEVKKDKDGLLPSKYLKIFVDFCVYTDSEYTSLSKLKSVRASWHRRYSAMMSNSGLCYSSGIIEPVLSNHAKIEGNAKLISAKDGPRPFQYKGRFTDAEQACTIGYSSSAKAHNTIRWLRNRQGYHKYGSTFITWNTNCRTVVSPQDGFDDDETVDIIDTEEVYSQKIRNTLTGYMKSPEFKNNPQIAMLGMESVTPGRMSINFYEEFDGRTYLENLSR